MPTFGTKAFAFHGRIAPGQGAFSLRHLICMKATLDRLVMLGTLEPLIPHHSEVMEMSLSGGAGIHPHAVLFIHLTFASWLLGATYMGPVLTSILDAVEADLVAAGLITRGLTPYFVRNSGTWKELCSLRVIWSAINYMLKTVGSACFACRGRSAPPPPPMPGSFWRLWLCVPSPTESSTPSTGLLYPLPVDDATARAQHTFKVQNPQHIRATNEYPPSHHCSEAALASVPAVARLQLLTAKAAAFDWGDHS